MDNKNIYLKINKFRDRQQKYLFFLNKVGFKKIAFWGMHYCLKIVFIIYNCVQKINFQEKKLNEFEFSCQKLMIFFCDFIP